MYLLRRLVSQVSGVSRVGLRGGGRGFQQSLVEVGTSRPKGVTGLKKTELNVLL